MTLAKTVTDNTDAAGIGIAGKDFDNTMHMFLDFMYSNGGTVIDTVTGEVKFDDVPARETLQLYADLMPVMAEGATALERGNLQALFEDGKIGMYVTGPWGMGQHKAKKFLAGPIPKGPSGGSGSILITDSIAVFKGSGVEPDAMKLAAFLTSGANQYSLDKEWGLPPIQKYDTMGITDLYYMAPEWKLFIDTIPTGKPEPMVYNFASLQAVFTNMIQGVMLGELTDINAAVTEAAEGIKAIQ